MVSVLREITRLNLHARIVEQGQVSVSERDVVERNEGHLYVVSGVRGV